jgi:hypothetical protein
MPLVVLVMSSYLLGIIQLHRVFNSAEKKASVKGKQGEKKEYTPFLPESKCALSMRGLAQLVDEKSN